MDKDIKTTDWLIKSIPEWRQLELKSVAALLVRLKLNYLESQISEKDYAKGLNISRKTLHKLLHDPVPNINIDTFFKLLNRFSPVNLNNY